MAAVALLVILNSPSITNSLIGLVQIVIHLWDPQVFLKNNRNKNSKMKLESMNYKKTIFLSIKSSTTEYVLVEKKYNQNEILLLWVFNINLCAFF